MTEDGTDKIGTLAVIAASSTLAISARPMPRPWYSGRMKTVLTTSAVKACSPNYPVLHDRDKHGPAREQIDDGCRGEISFDARDYRLGVILGVRFPQGRDDRATDALGILTSCRSDTVFQSGYSLGTVARVQSLS